MEECMAVLLRFHPFTTCRREVPLRCRRNIKPLTIGS